MHGRIDGYYWNLGIGCTSIGGIGLEGFEHGNVYDTAIEFTIRFQSLK